MFTALQDSYTKERALLALKVVVYCTFVLLLQTALIGDLYLTDVQVNLLFSSLIVFASCLSFFETIIAASFITISISMLLYDSQIYWFYPIAGALASWMNPNFVPDKFLIAILYTISFTPLFELMSTSSTPYWDRTMESVLLNVLTVIPLYVIIRLVFVPKQVRQQN